MRFLINLSVIALLVSLLGIAAYAQGVDDICREFGETPTRAIEGTRYQRFIYGRVVLKGVTSPQRPKVTVIYSDSSQPAIRQQLSESGNFCFRRIGNGGILLIDVGGVEVGRKSLGDLGELRTREDFEVYPPGSSLDAPPGVVSARFVRPPNDKTSDLYKKAGAAEADKKPDKAIGFVKQIVDVDPEDFIAWAKLGSLYLAQNSMTEAETAFRKALAVRADYTPALLNIGMIRAVEKKFPEAIELFSQAVAADPTSARAYRLLGEAYLQNRQGSLGLAALDKAIEIDPVGMAECHLLKARLYDLAGAKNLASHEYRVFLKKVPDHPDKKTLEKYIKDNPE